VATGEEERTSLVKYAQLGDYVDLLRDHDLRGVFFHNHSTDLLDAFAKQPSKKLHVETPCLPLNSP